MLNDDASAKSYRAAGDAPASPPGAPRRGDKGHLPPHDQTTPERWDPIPFVTTAWTRRREVLRLRGDHYSAGRP